MNDSTRQLWNKRKTIFIGSALLLAAVGLLFYVRHANNHDSHQTDMNEPSKTTDSEFDSRSGARLASSDSASVRPSDDLGGDPLDTLYTDTLAIELSNDELLDSWLDRDKVYLEIQSPARPFGLDVVEPVQMGGSDSRSQDFADNLLPEILDFIQTNKVNGNLAALTAPDTDTSNLTLLNPADLRVYFVADNGSYHNSIGMNFAGAAADEYVPTLIFPDASTMYPEDQGQNGDWAPISEEYPLIPGDFIDIGSVDAGSYLDFFIIPRGATEAANPSEAYVTDKTLNEDQTSHMRILGVAGDSMLVIGFEDLKNGGDQDYNDVVIAVDIGQQNLDSIAVGLGM